MSNKLNLSFYFILGASCAYYIFNHNFTIGWKHNNIEQVGHNNATAHIQCYENGKTMFNGFVSDLKQNEWGQYSFVQEHTGKRITINANCVVEQ